jgi:serine O-acetyltransferase
MNRLEKSKELLLQNYEVYGMVNRSDTENLPGRESIENIVLGLEELLFPGYIENPHADNGNLLRTTTDTVNQVSAK